MENFVEVNDLGPALQERIDGFMDRLLKWYKLNKRDYLFWRNTKNPYYVLVSEMMLQKTTGELGESSPNSPKIAA